jgi:hypothetical protein
MTDNDKQLRFQVLQMAQTMCDQEYLFAQEIKRDAKRKFPSEDDVIAKAKKLMTFVDDPADPTVKSVTQLLTEHMNK